MNNYEDTKHKIRTTWDFIKKSNNKYDDLLKQSISAMPISYIKNKNIHIIEEKYALLVSPNYYRSFVKTFLLKNFPENFLPFIRPIVILSTESAYESPDIMTEEDYINLNPNNVTPDNQVNKIHLIQNNQIKYFKYQTELGNKINYSIQISISAELKKRIKVMIPYVYYYDFYLPLYVKILLTLINLGEYDELRTNKT